MRSTRTKTEQRILQAARRVFISKGKDGARMQEIADAAGVNKMLLHYYFRSKNRLFNSVIENLIAEVFSSVFSSSLQAHSFRDFLKTFIERHIDFVARNQDILHFLLWEAGRNPAIIRNIVLKKFDSMGASPFTLLNEKISRAVREGEIQAVEAADFIVNLASLDIFIFIIKPFVLAAGGMTEEQFSEFSEGRKTAVFNLLWNSISPSQGAPGEETT